MKEKRIISNVAVTDNILPPKQKDNYSSNLNTRWTHVISINLDTNAFILEFLLGNSQVKYSLECPYVGYVITMPFKQYLS